MCPAQVLELVVAPVLVKMSDVANINQSALFEPFHAADNKYGICGMSVERSYEELTHVDDLRQWGIIGLLLCKGGGRVRCILEATAWHGVEL